MWRGRDQGRGGAWHNKAVSTANQSSSSLYVQYNLHTKGWDLILRHKLLISPADFLDCIYIYLTLIRIVILKGLNWKIMLGVIAVIINEFFLKGCFLPSSPFHLIPLETNKCPLLGSYSSKTSSDILMLLVSLVGNHWLSEAPLHKPNI